MCSNSDMQAMGRIIRNATLGQYGLLLMSAKTRYREQFRVEIRLQEQSGAASTLPVFAGIRSVGRGNFNIPGWMDGEYIERVPLGGAVVDLSLENLNMQFFRILGSTIPLGGSLMVAYSMFSNETEVHRQTKQALQRGLPPVASPLGFLLFEAGCRTVRDWYLAEGGAEGPPKLWGYKPRSGEDDAEKSRVLLRELRAFLASSGNSADPLVKRVASAASIIVARLGSAVS